MPDQASAGSLGPTEAPAEKDSAISRMTQSAAEHTLNQWPLLVVLGLLSIGLGITAAGHWRRGAFAMGCAVLLAGGFRVFMPTRVAGLLCVRSRWFDSALLLGMATAMLALTFFVPHSR